MHLPLSFGEGLGERPPYRTWPVSYRTWSVSYRTWPVSYRTWSVSYRTWSVSYRTWRFLITRVDFSSHVSISRHTYRFLVTCTPFFSRFETKKLLITKYKEFFKHKSLSAFTSNIRLSNHVHIHPNHSYSVFVSFWKTY